MILSGRQHLASTRPQVRTCPRCACVSLAGLAEGLHIQADPTPLNLEWQILCTLRQIPLYCLDLRGLYLLTASRATVRRRYPILPEHRCGVHWPNPTPIAASVAPAEPPY